MSGNLVSGELLLERLAEVVKGREDFVYERKTYEVEDRSALDVCVYSDGKGNPSCIVGQYLYKYHPEMFETIKNYEWMDPDVPAVRGVRFYSPHLEMEIGYQSIDLLKEAQQMQDTGVSWGEVLKGLHLVSDKLEGE